MQEQRQRRMGGRFYVRPFEVHDLLAKLPPGCGRIYDSILRHIIILEDWESEGEWVIGIFETTRGRLVELSGLSKTHLYRLWGLLVESSLINETDDGKFTLPMFKKKSDEGITVSEVKIMAQRMQDLEHQIEGMMILLQNLLEKSPIDGNLPLTEELQEVNSPSDGTDRPSGGTDRPSGGNPSYVLDQEGDQEAPLPSGGCTKLSTGGAANGGESKKQGGGGIFKSLKDPEFAAQAYDQLKASGVSPARALKLVKAVDALEGLEFAKKLYSALKAHKIKPEQALELVRDYDHEVIRRNILGIRRDYEAGEKIKHPNKLLIWRIKNDYDPENIDKKSPPTDSEQGDNE